MGRNPPKRKQQEIPGTEPQRIESLDEAALEYAARRDRRIAELAKEKQAYEVLLSEMNKHNKDVYKFEDANGEVFSVERVATEVKIKVRKVKDTDDIPSGAKNDDDEDGDGE